MRAFLILLLAAAPAAAQLELPEVEVRVLRDGLKVFGGRLAPAPVEEGPVRELYRRLADSGPRFMGQENLPDGRARLRSVALFEIPTPPDCSGAVCRTVLRRTFTHIEAVVETQQELPDGTTFADSWKYELGLDGSIRFCARIQFYGRFDERGVFNIDETRSRVLRMSPSDPAVQTRWKRHAQEFLRLGPPPLEA